MSRNMNSHFALAPSINIERSKMTIPYRHTFSANVGELVPFFNFEILPGDSVKIHTSMVARLQSLITPAMTDMVIDTYYFNVPNRLVWNHWKEFMGENTESAWIPTTEYTVPQTTAPVGGWDEGTIADHMGMPTGVDNIEMMSLPLRAYALICNEWFRDQNVTDPLVITTTDSDTAGSNGGTYTTDVEKGGKPFIAAKFHDYFTSCLPSAQKGNPVRIGISGAVPVYTGVPFDIKNFPKIGQTNYHYALSFKLSDESTLQQYNNTTAAPYLGSTGSAGNGVMYQGNSTTTLTNKTGGMVPNNLYADLAQATMSDVSQLRTAFAIQKLLEKNAMGGSRYTELLRMHFSVTSPDARQQRPEYLGGHRVPIKISQVVQTSESSSTPQGNVAGYSLTGDTHEDLVFSSTEHSWIIGVAVVRYMHDYQQGIPRPFSRKTRYDYYWPVFQNLGFQAVKNKEIYAQGTDTDEETFGYQERWAEYRYKPNTVSGEMKSNATTSLDFWHTADNYSQLPTLSDGWIREDKSNVDRILAVTSAVSNQILYNVDVETEATRPMPLHSIPGLIDHH